MNINLEEIKKSARLCKFDITEEEAALYSKQLSAVIGWVQALQVVDTSAAHAPAPQPCPLRLDTPVTDSAAQDICTAFNDKQNNFLKVKKVL